MSAEHVRLRGQGKRLVACSGSFDILHDGHRLLLKKCRTKGDVLLVLLNTDESIRLYKGPLRPLNPLAVRIAQLSESEYVDYVVPFAELNPIAALQIIQPEIYCNGSDWGANSIERPVVEGYGGEFMVVDSDSSVRTSSLLPDEYKKAERETAHAIFLDRDGVIIEDRGYVHQIEDVTLLPGVGDALSSLRSMGWKLLVASNQSGVGRGMFTESAVGLVHTEIQRQLSNFNVSIDGFYYCPHAPDAGCLCRKPGTQMFEHAAVDHALALGKSWMIGDRETDVLAGRYANMQSILISSGHEPTSAHYRASNLLDAVEIIKQTTVK